ncbi:hypothetical protein [Geobacter pickeringii]|uniref:Uncharacterized protein n=1 Tax=Geobacter pickeringii TaxID=345632 RepID=A0A0B5BBK1_9BACT|nr:hypothetical protein [Geobacter pickeringii]AJE03912.1 hypothetical protein GPICK_11625 [Geobacter pickeringii]
MPWMVCVVFILAAIPAWGGEFSGYGGMVQNNGMHDTSYAWQLEYLNGVGENFAVSLSYLNEGHVPNHHRDGNAVTLWARTALLERRLTLAAGGGPYLYYDTTAPPAGGQSFVDHGVGGMLSLAVTWYSESRWLLGLRTNWVKSGTSVDTISTLLGIGYQLDSPPSFGVPATAISRPETGMDNEITLFLGESILNRFDSEHSTALSIEYRRDLLRHLEWSAGWLYEGERSLYRRNSLLSQFWLTDSFFADRLVIGFGAGPCVTVDHNEVPPKNGGGNALSAIVTMTGSYRLDPRWNLRASWSRLATGYNQDADVILGGVGYRF